MSKVRIVKKLDGFEVWGCGKCGVEKYFDRVSASNLINVHPETLTRLYRNHKGNTNPSAGLKIGRDLFFTREHLSYLGYGVPSEDNLTQAMYSEGVEEVYEEQKPAELEKNNEPCMRQDLLYLQSQSTSIMSPVHGMSLVENGNVYDGPDDPKDWPYKTVLDAINDGWRIIKFPEMALLMDQDRTYGLGREFILERWSK